MKYISLLLIFIGLSVSVFSQNLRFSFQLGAAIPQADFAKSENHPNDGGFAQIGFDMKLVVAKLNQNNIVLGVNVGYSVFGVDKEAVRSFFDSSNLNNIQIETQSFQNVNLQVRLGYDLVLPGEHFRITPFVDGGIGVLNSAYYLVIQNNGDSYLRAGNSGLSLIVTPGMDVLVSLNDFLSLNIYGSYQMANYTVEESFITKIASVSTTTSKEVDYNYRNLSTGLGLTIMF